MSRITCADGFSISVVLIEPLPGQWPSSKPIEVALPSQPEPLLGAVHDDDPRALPTWRLTHDQLADIIDHHGGCGCCCCTSLFKSADGSRVCAFHPTTCPATQP